MQPIKNRIKRTVMNDRIRKFCKLCNVSLVEAEKKLEEIAGRDCLYFATKKTKGQAMVWLYFTVISLTKNRIKNILEIGTGKGTTTNIISNLFPESQIYTIDLPNSDFSYNKLAVRNVENGEEELRKNINRQNIHFFENNSFFLLTLDLPEYFDFIYIDGGHNYPTVAWDFMFSYNKLNKNGFLFMDDYNRPGTDVKSMVDFLIKIIPEKVHFLPWAYYDKNAKYCWLQKI